jgi:hypothetical protein
MPFLGNLRRRRCRILGPGMASRERVFTPKTGPILGVKTQISKHADGTNRTVWRIEPIGGFALGTLPGVLVRGFQS